MYFFIKKFKKKIYKKRFRKKQKVYSKMEIDVHKNPQDSKSQHIMFSYSWEHKHNVRHIYDIINKEFEDVPKWIDTDSMSGNIFEAMNNAIEDAFLVIVFLSSDYKKSKNCKNESELIIGKQKDYILVLTEDNFPYNLEDEKNEDNWIYKMYKDQFYIDLSKGMEQEKITKLLSLISTKINKYYGYQISERRPSFLRKKSNPKCSPLKSNNSPVKKRTSPIVKSIKGTNIFLDTNELDNFILSNDLEQNDIDNIKNLMQQTPRTMIPTLQASGMSFKGILEIINDIKNDDD